MASPFDPVVTSVQIARGGGYIAVIDGVTVSVPEEPSNRHYRAIRKWIRDGNTPEQPPVAETRTKLLSQRKAEARREIDQMGDEYTRLKLLMNYTDLRLKPQGQRTAEEQARFEELQLLVQFAQDVQTEYLRVKTELANAEDPETVADPTWPTWPPVRDTEEL